MQDDGVIFSPNAISSPNKRVMHQHEFQGQCQNNSRFCFLFTRGKLMIIVYYFVQKGRRFSTRESSGGGVLRAPHRFVCLNRGLIVSFRSSRKRFYSQATCKGCEGLLLWVSY